MRVIQIGMWIAIVLVAVMTSACSFSVGVDWNGQTAKDYRTFTEKENGKAK